MLYYSQRKKGGMRWRPSRFGKDGAGRRTVVTTLMFKSLSSSGGISDTYGRVKTLGITEELITESSSVVYGNLGEAVKAGWRTVLENAGVIPRRVRSLREWRAERER